MEKSVIQYEFLSAAVLFYNGMDCFRFLDPRSSPFVSGYLVRSFLESAGSNTLSMNSRGISSTSRISASSKTRARDLHLTRKLLATLVPSSSSIIRQLDLQIS